MYKTIKYWVLLLLLIPCVNASVNNYWSFDVDATADVGGVDGTVTGATNQGTGCGNNNCYDFNGAGDFINFSTNILFGIGDSFSVCMWFEQDTTDGYLFTEGRWNSNEPFMWRIDTAMRWLQTDTDANYEIDDGFGSNRALNALYHACYVLDAGNNRTLYYNGTFEEVQSSNLINVESQAGTFSLLSASSGSGSDWWDGTIDELVIYNNPLTSAEVATLFANNGVPPSDAPPNSSNYVTNATNSSTGDSVQFNATYVDETALDSFMFSHNHSGTWVNDSPNEFPSTELDNAIAYWSFDINGSDDSDNSHDVSINGATHNTTAQKLGAGCYDFDGDNDYLTDSDLSVFEERTYSAWVFVNGTQDSTNRIMQHSPGGTKGIELRCSANACTNFYASANSGFEVTTTGTYAVNAWHHIVVTIKTNNMTVYVDGSQDGSDGTGTGDNETANIFIGAESAAAKFLDGLIDEVAIWNETLSVTEILELYNGAVGFNPYNIIEGRATTVMQVNLTEEAGSALGWAYWGNDSDGNWNYTGIQTLNMSVPVTINITEVWLTSPVPDQKLFSPAVTGNTSDLTPTFNLTTSAVASCLLRSNSSIWINCSTTNSTGHICTQSTSLAYGLNEQYFSCNVSYQENVTSLYENSTKVWHASHGFMDVFDNDWSTYGYIDEGVGNLYINYSVPEGASDALWRVKTRVLPTTSTGTFNLMVPTTCWNSTTLELRMWSSEYSSTGNISLLCRNQSAPVVYIDSGLNTTGWVVLYSWQLGGPPSYFVPNIYEEAVWWASSLQINVSVASHITSLTINSPADNTVVLENYVPSFNFTVVDPDNATVSCDFYVDGVVNASNSSVTTSTPTLVQSTGLVGTYNYSWYINCTDDGIAYNTTDVRYLYSIRNISTTLNYPADNTATRTGNRKFNWTVIGTQTAYSCGFYIDSILNFTNATTANNTVASKSLTLGEANYTWYVNCSSGNVNNYTGTRSLNLTILYGNVTLTNCLGGDITVIPDAGNSTGVAPQNQSTKGCSFNITNINNTGLNFKLRYTGTMGYYHHYYLDTFTVLKSYKVGTASWVNDTYYNITYKYNSTLNKTYEGQYNFTRYCFGAIELFRYLYGYANASSDMLVVRYRFNNSEDVLVDIWGNQSFDDDTNITTMGWTQINTTFGCPLKNYIQFNTTKTNYSRYDEANMGYRLSDNTSDIVHFSLNITDDQGTSVVSPYTLVDSSTFTYLKLNISTLNMSDLASYALYFNGSSNGAAVFDDLILNDTTRETKLSFYAGNNTYTLATNLTGSYQSIFNLTANQTMPLKFWFDFNFPLLGVSLDLSLLEYAAEVS